MNNNTAVLRQTPVPAPVEDPWLLDKTANDKNGDYETAKPAATKPTKAVSFHQIQVRLYPVLCSDYRITLGWDYSKEEQMGIEEYESQSSTRVRGLGRWDLRVTPVDPYHSPNSPPLSGFAEWHKLRTERNIHLEQRRRQRRSQIARRFMAT